MTAPDQIVTIGKSISGARVALGWKQSELAARSGLSRSDVAKIESYNVKNISVLKLSAIGSALGCPNYMATFDAADWEKMTDLIAGQVEEKVRRYYRSNDRISPEEVARIEAMAKSRLKKDFQLAVTRINVVVERILNYEDGGIDELPEDIKRSRIAAIGMAVTMIPHTPIANGLTACVLAT